MAVCVSLVDEYLGAGLRIYIHTYTHMHIHTHVCIHMHMQLRQFGFMLRGLKEVEEECLSLGIPFFLLRGHAQVDMTSYDLHMI